ncbi:MAG TPA: helix-turn-helix domain-containing protein [Thermoanaerobaculia bacterium]|nr:helix-turn-helix domain-containing protein [Thermoanaerobaculia bacterium]
MEIDLFKALFQKDTAFRDRVLAFTSSFLTQVTQNLVCNRLHHIEERLAKWLLVVQDRVDSDALHLTHDFLSHMLGIHRPGVSIAVAALERDGLVSHTRARITIRDRTLLEARSCECFKAIHGDLAQLRKKLSA